MVLAPPIKGAAAEELQELVAIGEDEQHRLGVFLLHGPHVLKDENKGNQGGEEILHTLKAPLRKDSRLLAGQIAGGLVVVVGVLDTAPGCVLEDLQDPVLRQARVWGQKEGHGRPLASQSRRVEMEVVGEPKLVEEQAGKCFREDGNGDHLEEEI